MPIIKNYAVRINGGTEGSGQGIRAQVHLVGEGSKMLGWINFYDAGASLPPDTGEPHIIMNLPAAQLGPVVDLLRNESPVYLQWQARISNAFIGTTHEPVGEGEVEADPS